MAQTIQILRTTTNNPPPTLLPGALSAELGPQTKLWIGAAAGNRLLLSTDPTDITLSGGAIIASAAPNAMPGSLWWDSNIGQLYIRYFDGNSTAWVSASTGTSVAIPIAVASGGTGAVTAPEALTNLGAVAKAGDLMTGTLTISPATGNAGLVLSKAVAGTATNVTGYTGSSARWQMELGGAGAESGSNAGSDFTINRFNDAGAYFGTVLTITRASGVATFSGNITALNIVMTGSYQYFAGGGGNINTNGGPLIFGDNGYMIFKKGSVDNSFLWQNYAGATQMVLDTGGNIQITGAGAIKAGGGAWTAPSSIGLKDEASIADYGRGLADILQLNPIVYIYNGTAGLPKDQIFAGLAAEDVLPVMPEMVVPISLGGQPATEDMAAVPPIDTLGVDSSPLIFALVNAVKELNAKVEALAPAAPPARR